MPTYNQLDDEASWRAELAAPALVDLAAALQDHWPAAEVGIRGDNGHLNGYHRSRRWIKESQFCTNRTYSVSRTSGDVSGGNSNWACAIDFGGIPQAELHAVCKRLDAAVRAGRLEKVTEWYGNFGGDDRVDGWDNISDRIASSDSSHLSHLHMSFDRGRANEDHSDLLAILTGEDDMALTDPIPLPAGQYPELGGQKTARFDELLGYMAARGLRQELQMAQALKVIELIAAKVDLDPAELEALKAAAAAGAQAGVVGSAQALAVAIVAELHDELGLTPDQVQAATERAVRKVLGALDAA